MGPDPRPQKATPSRTSQGKPLEPESRNGRNGHNRHSPSPLQIGKNVSYSICATAKRALNKILSKQPHVHFAPRAQICTFHAAQTAITVTYDSGADGHYLSEQDRARAQLPILRRSTKFVGVANGDTSRGTNVTRLPVPDLPDQATEADTFNSNQGKWFLEK